MPETTPPINGPAFRDRRDRTSACGLRQRVRIHGVTGARSDNSETKQPPFTPRVSKLPNRRFPLPRSGKRLGFRFGFHAFPRFHPRAGNGKRVGLVLRMICATIIDANLAGEVRTLRPFGDRPFRDVHFLGNIFARGHAVAHQLHEHIQMIHQGMADMSPGAVRLKRPLPRAESFGAKSASAAVRPLDWQTTHRLRARRAASPWLAVLRFTHCVRPPCVRRK